MRERPHRRVSANADGSFRFFGRSRIEELERLLAEASDDSDGASSRPDEEDKSATAGSSSAEPASRKRKAASLGSAQQSVLSLRCDACGISVTSQELMREHMQGRKHAAAVRVQEARAEGRFCECCSLVFTSKAQFIEHQKGKKHREAQAAQRRCAPCTSFTRGDDSAAAPAASTSYATQIQSNHRWSKKAIAKKHT